MQGSIPEDSGRLKLYHAIISADPNQPAQRVTVLAANLGEARESQRRNMAQELYLTFTTKKTQRVREISLPDDCSEYAL